MLQKFKIVSRSEFFGTDGYRYFDNTFPFIIYFEIVSDADSEREAVLLYMMLQAMTDPAS